MATFVFASNLRKSDFKIINNMQWLNSFAFDNKRRSCTRSPSSWTQKHVDCLTWLAVAVAERTGGAGGRLQQERRTSRTNFRLLKVKLEFR